MTKEQVILFIFFLLISKNQWKIIIVLIFIYFYYKLEENTKTPISENVKEFNNYINNINYECPDNFYYNKYINLEKLKNKYPKELIKYEQIKLINSMLHQIPLKKEEYNKWINYKNELLNEII